MATISWIQFNEPVVAMGLAGVADVANRPLRQLMAASGDGPDGPVLGYSKPGHTHDWSDIVSGKPTTLAGYGITDGLTVAQGDARYVQVVPVPTTVAVDHIAVIPTSITLTITPPQTQVSVDHIVVSPTTISLSLPAPVIVPTTPGQLAQIGFARTNFSGITTTDADWAYGTPIFRMRLAIATDPTTMFSRNPNGKVGPYALHEFTEYTASPSNAVAWGDLAASWAAANGKNVEGIFLHAAIGQNNQQVTIASITASGLVTFGINNQNNKQFVSNGFTVGQQFSITGTTNSDFNTTATITGIPSNTSVQINLTSSIGAAGGIMFRPGDGTLTFANRLDTSGESERFWSLNPGSPEGKAFSIYRYGLLLGTQANIVFFDSHSVSNLQWKSVEYGQVSNVQYVNDLSTLLQTYRATYPGTISLPNIANSVTAQDAQMANAPGGCQRETGLSLFSFDHFTATGQGGPFTLALLANGTLVELVFSQTFNSAEPHAGLVGLSTAFRNSGSTFYSTPDDRAEMCLYAQSLLMTDRKFLYIDPANAFWAVSPISARWESAFELDIGIPTTTGFTNYVSVPGSSTPSGVPVTIFGRLFTSDGTPTGTPTAIVLARLNEHASTIYDSTTIYNWTVNVAPPTGMVWSVLTDTGAKSGSYKLGDQIPLQHIDAAILVTKPSGTSWFASPTGLHTNAGTRNSPFDIATLFAGGFGEQPGDQLLLLPGNYGTGAESYTVTVNGSPTNPIIIDADSSGKVSINCTEIDIQGSYTWFFNRIACNVEVYRNTGGTLTDGTDGIRMVTNGVGNKFINIVVHDMAGVGISPQSETADNEVNGNIVYNNGRSPTLAPTYGHGIYAHGTTTPGQKRKIRGNICFNQIGYGFHEFADTGNLVNFDIEFNIGLNNGIGNGTDFLIGGQTVLTNAIVRNNVGLRTDKQYTAFLGYIQYSDLTPEISGGNFENNYWHGGAMYGNLDNSGVSIQFNTTVATDNQATKLLFHGSIVALGNGTIIDNNTYATLANGAPFGLFATDFGPSGTETVYSTFADYQAAIHQETNSTYTAVDNLGTQIFVIPNDYVKGRGHVAIDNPSGASTVNVNISSIVAIGKPFSIYHVYDLPTATNPSATPVLSSVLGSGGVVSIPMTGKTPKAVIGGGFTPTNGLPNLGAFLVLQTG